MPDMERLSRSLELHLALTPEARAYADGKHAGQDQARKQIAWLVALVAALVVAISSNIY